MEIFKFRWEFIKSLLTSITGVAIELRSFAEN